MGKLAAGASVARRLPEHRIIPTPGVRERAIPQKCGRTPTGGVDTTPKLDIRFAGNRKKSEIVEIAGLPAKSTTF
jgi:hypothetical protein